MKLSRLATRFVETHNNFDGEAFTACFTDSAIVHDEGKTHTGKEEIRQWIEHSNEQYHSSMEPLNFEESGSAAVLTAEVTGAFPGSPIVLKFHFTLKNDLIDSLKVTG